MSDEQIRNLYQRKTDRIIGRILRIERFRCVFPLVCIEDFRVEPAGDEVGSHVLIGIEILNPLPAYPADKRMDEAEAFRMGIDLYGTLKILHGCGMIHQYVKPDNFFINDLLPSGVIFKPDNLDSLLDLSEAA